MKTKFAELFAIMPILSSWIFGVCAARGLAKARNPNADTRSARFMPAPPDFPIETADAVSCCIEGTDGIGKKQQNRHAVVAGSAGLRGFEGECARRGWEGGPLGTLVLLLALMADPTPAIRVDQVGYPVGAPKVAFLASKDAGGRSFTVRRSDGGVAFEGTLRAPLRDADSGDDLQIIDFSNLDGPGRYYIEIPEVGRSFEFRVADEPYLDLLRLAVRSYYGQRCGVAVSLGADCAACSHAECHREGAYDPSSGKSGPAPSRGGWHDAGDYGRYVVNSGLSTGTLLWAFELFRPPLASLRLAIPESGGATPDYLSEVRWNLEWMLTMQDADGGVWHKQTSTVFAPFVRPEEDHLPSAIIGTGSAPFKSSCATGDLAAVMAIAARTYTPYDGPFSATSLAAARRAWSWLSQNPSVVFRNPAGVKTGEYGDARCGDETLWAAAELFRTTREEPYRRYVLEHLGDFERPFVRPPSWPDVEALALWSYALASDDGAAAQIRAATLKEAGEVAARTIASPYRMSLLRADYVWGSNAVAANYGMEMLVAHRFRPDRILLDAALEDLHYLLGRNAFSESFITKVGANPCRHPHHRPSVASGETWPGLLCGGPNAGRQDPALRALPADLPPARVYVDEWASYAGNEVAINWNAPLVFLLAGISTGE
jgi:endoglucanase